MTPTPRLSVIVPAHGAAHLLPDTLTALAASTLPRASWELIVVDDASRDETARVAAPYADLVLTLPAPARGPGGARNAGAARARGEWLVFIDADVRVHPDTLARFAAAGDDDIVAVFGSYDDAPAASGLISEYRNLLHRYVHLRGAGDAETFWAGCGAVRRDAFEAIGGFDTQRFPRPQIEDIELGYRLRDRGGRIRLDPAIQGTHLKRWNFWQMLRTDLRDRGVPWTRLLLERRGRTSTSLNATPGEQAKVALAGLGAAALLAALVLGDARIALLAVALLATVTAMNGPTLAWFLRERGMAFAVAVVPLQLIYYVGNALAGATGVALHLGSRPAPLREVAR